MQRRPRHVVTVLVTVLLASAWSAADQVSAKRLVLPVDEKPSECVFDLFDGDPAEQGARDLLRDMGIGFLKAKEGTLVLVDCGSAGSFPGWVDSTGDLVSTLQGYGFNKMRPSGIPRLADTADASALRVLEKKNGTWHRLAGAFKTVTATLAPGSKAPSAAYTTFAGGSVSDHTARILSYVGVATTGRQSRVKLIVGDYHGTGIVDTSGKLTVLDQTTWNRDR